MTALDQPSSFPLYAMPAAEVSFFAGAAAVYPTQPLLGTFMLLLAAVALCLSLHLSYHEAAHRSGRWPTWRRVLTGFLLTPLMGLSFHGYRLSHWNHHRYNNGLADFTTTWKDRNGEPQPQNVLIYCLSWPKVFLNARLQSRVAAADGDASPQILRWSGGETVLQLLGLTLLAWLSPVVLLLYVTLIYLGWFFVSLHNYGQHLPRRYETSHRTTSFQAHWYNRALFNNGLHYEHHRTPDKPIAELEADDTAELVTVPHLLAPLIARS